MLQASGPRKLPLPWPGFHVAQCRMDISQVSMNAQGVPQEWIWVANQPISYCF